MNLNFINTIQHDRGLSLRVCFIGLSSSPQLTHLRRRSNMTDTKTAGGNNNTQQTIMVMLGKRSAEWVCGMPAQRGIHRAQVRVSK